jgi:hypothetical protein
MWRRLWAFGQQGNCDQDSTGLDAELGGFKQIALEIEADHDQVPGFRCDQILVLFQVGDPDFYRETAYLFPQDLDGGGRAVHCCDTPALLREPDGMSAGAACEVERLAGFEMPDDFGYEGNRQRRFVAGLLAVALLPILQIHVLMIA